VHFGNGEADAVDGDGAFEDEVAFEFGWGVDLEEVIAAPALESFDDGKRIDVAGNEMAMEPASSGEGSLQVYEGAGMAEL
jgi:hypothetical protein